MKTLTDFRKTVETGVDPRLARPSGGSDDHVKWRVRDVKIVSPVSTFLLNQ